MLYYHKFQFLIGKVKPKLIDLAEELNLHDAEFQFLIGKVKRWQYRTIVYISANK